MKTKQKHDEPKTESNSVVYDRVKFIGTEPNNQNNSGATQFSCRTDLCMCNMKWGQKIERIREQRMLPSIESRECMRTESNRTGPKQKDSRIQTPKVNIHQFYYDSIFSHLFRYNGCFFIYGHTFGAPCTLCTVCTSVHVSMCRA